MTLLEAKIEIARQYPFYPKKVKSHLEIALLAESKGEYSIMNRHLDKAIELLDNEESKNGN